MDCFFASAQACVAQRQSARSLAAYNRASAGSGTLHGTKTECEHASAGFGTLQGKQLGRQQSVPSFTCSCTASWHQWQACMEQRKSVRSLAAYTALQQDLGLCMAQRQSVKPLQQDLGPCRGSSWAGNRACHHLSGPALLLCISAGLHGTKTECEIT